MKQIMLSAVVLAVFLSACTMSQKQGQLNSSVETTKPTTAPTTFTTKPTTEVTTVPITKVTTAPTTVPTTQLTTVPTTMPTTVTTTASTTMPTTTPTTGNPPASCERSISVDSYEEYLTFVENTHLPEYFVHVDQLPEIGEFDCFIVFQRYINDGTFVDYSYLFKNGSDFFVQVDICHHKEQEVTTKNYIFGLNGNLTKIDYEEKESKYYQQNGVTYKYLLGNLYSITWENHNTQFTMRAESPYHSDWRWPAVEGTSFVRNLLHTDTVETAMQSFKASMEAAAVK